MAYGSSIPGLVFKMWRGTDRRQTTLIKVSVCYYRRTSYYNDLRPWNW